MSIANYEFHIDRTSYLREAGFTNEIRFMEDAESLLSSSQIRVEIDGDTVVVDVESTDVDPVSIEHLSGSTYSILYRGRTITATLMTSDVDYLEFSIHGTSYRCNVTNRRMQILESLGVTEGKDSHEGELSSPMPGLVVKILVDTGATVQKGAPLIVLEAMKMENEIRSPIDAVVSEIHVNSGQSVPKNTLLISLDALPIG